MKSILKLELLACRVVLGISASDEIILTANDVLEKGLYSDSIGELSYIDKNVGEQKIINVFKKSLEEVGIKLPLQTEAANRLISEHLQLILDGDLNPRTGIMRLKNEVLDPINGLNADKKFVGDKFNLEKIVSVYSTYDDIEESPDLVSYENKFGQEALMTIDNDIKFYANKWLNNNKSMEAGLL